MLRYPSGHMGMTKRQRSAQAATMAPPLLAVDLRYHERYRRELYTIIRPADPEWWLTVEPRMRKGEKILAQFLTAKGAARWLASHYPSHNVRWLTPQDGGCCMHAKQCDRCGGTGGAGKAEFGDCEPCGGSGWMHKCHRCDLVWLAKPQPYCEKCAGKK